MCPTAMNCVTLIPPNNIRKHDPATLVSMYNIKKRPITRNAIPSPGHIPRNGYSSSLDFLFFFFFVSLRCLRSLRLDNYPFYRNFLRPVQIVSRWFRVLDVIRGSVGNLYFSGVNHFLKENIFVEQNNWFENLIK